MPLGLQKRRPKTPTSHQKIAQQQLYKPGLNQLPQKKVKGLKHCHLKLELHHKQLVWSKIECLNQIEIKHKSVMIDLFRKLTHAS